MSQPIPPIQKRDDWEEFSLPFKIGSGRELDGSGRAQSWRMAFFRRVTDGHLVGKVWFTPVIEGPPGHVHGGVSAFVLDEAMGSAAWIQGYPCVAAHIEVDFLKMTPVEVDLDVEAAVVKVEKKRVQIEGKIFNAQTGEVFSKALGHFHRVSQELVEKFVQQSEESDLDLSQFHFAEDS